MTLPFVKKAFCREFVAVLNLFTHVVYGNTNDKNYPISHTFPGIKKRNYIIPRTCNYLPKANAKKCHAYRISIESRRRHKDAQKPVRNCTYHNFSTGFL